VRALTERSAPIEPGSIAAAHAELDHELCDGRYSKHGDLCYNFL
jgi:hypothetical protein